MTQPQASDLRSARDTAATAHVFAVVCLVAIGINVVFRVGRPLVAALAGDGKPWREDVHAIGLVLIALLPTILFYEAVNQLRHALGHYRNGEFFATTAATRVARAGDYALSALAAVILVVPNVTAWVSQRGGGGGGFEVNLQNEFIGMIAFALLISVAGRVLAAAAQLKAENDSFV